MSHFRGKSAANWGAIGTGLGGAALGGGLAYGVEKPKDPNQNKYKTWGKRIAGAGIGGLVGYTGYRLKTELNPKSTWNKDPIGTLYDNLADPKKAGDIRKTVQDATKNPVVQMAMASKGIDNSMIDQFINHAESGIKTLTDNPDMRKVGKGIFTEGVDAVVPGLNDNLGEIITHVGNYSKTKDMKHLSNIKEPIGELMTTLEGFDPEMLKDVTDASKEVMEFNKKGKEFKKNMFKKAGLSNRGQLLRDLWMPAALGTTGSIAGATASYRNGDPEQTTGSKIMRGAVGAGLGGMVGGALGMGSIMKYTGSDTGKKILQKAFDSEGIARSELIKANKTINQKELNEKMIDVFNKDTELAGHFDKLKYHKYGIGGLHASALGGAAYYNSTKSNTGKTKKSSYFSKFR